MAATTTICIEPGVNDLLTNLTIDCEPLSDGAIQGIEEALEDIKQGLPTL